MVWVEKKIACETMNFINMALVNKFYGVMWLVVHHAVYVLQ